MPALIALVGRPNVGKSTLFNYLTQSRDALVADFPGLTRDRKYGICRRYSSDTIIVDTGGVVSHGAVLDEAIVQQTRQAIFEADTVLMMVDANDGLTPEDEYIANWLRKSNKDFNLVVNKVDGQDQDIASSEFYRLGALQTFPVSAKRGRGIRQMLVQLQVIDSEAEEAESVVKEEESEIPRIAIVGRPNAGKSTLINALLKDERMIVSDIAGTTRDTVSTLCSISGHSYYLTDTAGIRRKSKTHEAIEKFSIAQALGAISSAHVVVLVVDSTEGLTDQDSTLVEVILREGRALVLALNKSDVADQDHQYRLQYALDTRFQYIAFAEKIPISGKKCVGLRKLMKAVDNAYRSASISISTPDVNKLLEAALAAHQPPMIRGRRVKIRYAHQAGSHPPAIVLHGNQLDRLPDSYIRYLENYFSQSLHIVGTPIRFFMRTSKNPYEGKYNKLTPRQQRKRERLIKRRQKN